MLMKMHPRNLLFAARRANRFPRYCTFEYNFDSKEEITLNFLNKIMLIGLNIPEKKNLLSESALDKIMENLKRFEKEKELSVVVLHGIGGNFCTGMEETEEAIRKGNEIIRIMAGQKKPIVGTLHGHTKNFGFQLALMCDLLAIDETGLVSLGDRESRGNVPKEIYKRLVSIVGVNRALEMAITKCSWSAEEAKAYGLVNQCVECGTAFGKTIGWAQSIAKIPSEIIVEEKMKICSVMCKGLEI